MHIDMPEVPAGSATTGAQDLPSAPTAVAESNAAALDEFYGLICCLRVLHRIDFGSKCETDAEGVESPSAGERQQTSKQVGVTTTETAGAILNFTGDRSSRKAA